MCRLNSAPLRIGRSASRSPDKTILTGAPSRLDTLSTVPKIPPWTGTEPGLDSSFNEIIGMLHPFQILAQAEGNTTEPTGLNEIFHEVEQYLGENGADLLWNILAAIVILVVGRWAAKLLTRLIEKLTTRARVDETLVKFVSNMAYWLMLVMIIVAAIDQIGIDTTSFAALVAASGLAVGLALQGSLSNFAAGVMIILFKPIRVGDYAEAGGTAGVVEEIQIFHTMMRTGDNKQIIVPNSMITGDTITNFSAKTTRRIDLLIGCGYDDDLQGVKKFLEEVLQTEEDILEDPEPIVRVHELGDSSINFIVRPWVPSSEYWEVKWSLTEKIKLGFDERGFTFPFPSRDVHVHNAEAA